MEEKRIIKCMNEIDRDKVYKTIAPGSKSITNRALLIAAMADGKSTLRGCLTSDDAKHFLNCLKDLGFSIEETFDGALGSNISITGMGGKIPKKEAEIYVGSAGTAARFLVAMLAFSDGTYTVRSSEQMKKRPMQPLIDSLRSVGAKVTCLEEEGHFPLRIKGVLDLEKIPASITVNIDKSSQFLSALLVAVGALGKRMEIKVTGNHGLAYVDMTVDMMRDFGVTVQKDKNLVYIISGEDSYKALDYQIEPDMSAAAYFYGAAALLSIKVMVKGVKRKMLQGDTKILDVFEQMGASFIDDPYGVMMMGPEDGILKGGISIDMSSFSDQALTLAAIAPFADDKITITGIGHIRLQECDRIHAICKNLETIGIKVIEKDDQVTIYPGVPHGGEIETFDDHRVAMSFALTGLRTEGVVILNPGCCRKTFAEYFEVMEDMLCGVSKDGSEV